MTTAPAGLVAAGLAPKSMTPRVGGAPGEIGALVLTLLVCAFLYRAGRSRVSSDAPRP